MMLWNQRIYWLLPDLASARRTMDDLLLARVPVRHIHFVAREGLDMSELHEANILQTSDVVPAVQVGGTLGGALGAAAGAVVALWAPFGGETASPVVVLALIALGAVFGVWTSGMIGVSTPSRRLARFGPEIERGRILLMVDVPRDQVEYVEARLERLHPEASLEGVEPNTPAFP